MEHQHQPEAQVKKATTDHSKMDHSTMQHGHNPFMGMEGHNHAMMIAFFLGIGNGAVLMTASTVVVAINASLLKVKN